MSRDASTLADVREPTLAIVCERSDRRGRYNVERLIAAHGADMRLLTVIADCAKARSFSVYDPCKAVYEGFKDRWGQH